MDHSLGFLISPCNRIYNWLLRYCTKRAYAVDVELESGFYVGIVLSAILYGIYVLIAFVSIYLLLMNKRITRTQRLCYIAYGVVLLLLNTVTFAFWTLLGQMTWIIHRNDYGGPLVYFENHHGYWYILVGDSTQIVANILADALIIYRCYIVFNRKFWSIVLPVLCFLVFIVTDAIVEYKSGTHGWSNSKILAFDGTNVIFTIVVNVLVTLMICIRLLFASKKTYRTIMAILVESAALLSATGIALCTLSWLQSPLFTCVALVWFIIGGISPQLIILRLALTSRRSPTPMGNGHETTHSEPPSLTVVEVEKVNPENAIVAGFIGDMDVSVSEWRIASRNTISLRDQRNASGSHQQSRTVTTSAGTFTMDLDSSADNDESSFETARTSESSQTPVLHTHNSLGV